MPNDTYAVEQYTDSQVAILGHYFTNTDRPVFGLINLPEVVKGALFARYSRSPLGLRRLFLDEFVNRAEVVLPRIAHWNLERHLSCSDDERDPRLVQALADVGIDHINGIDRAFLKMEEPIDRENEARRERNQDKPKDEWEPMLESVQTTLAREIWQAEPELPFELMAADLASSKEDQVFSEKHAAGLYRRVFDEYGDDSVAQDAGAHVACEQASNILVKVLEWSRLMAFLEQSTRYMDYSVPQSNGLYRYYRDPDIMSGQHAEAFVAGMDAMFDGYKEMLPHAIAYFRELHPRQDFPGDDRAYEMSLRTSSYDTIRTMLPAGTASNLGVYGSAQAYNNMLYRMLSSELAEARSYGEMILQELRHPNMIPAFVNQIDDPDKGEVWIRYLEETRAGTQTLAESWHGRGLPTDLPGYAPAQDDDVQLVSYGQSNEIDVAAWIKYEDGAGQLTLQECKDWVTQNRSALPLLIGNYAGDRINRRHKPGRAFEVASYEFDILADFGIFRDLQRHRMLTIVWQPLSTAHGWVMSPFIEDMGQTALYERVMNQSAELYGQLLSDHPQAAQYAVALGYKLRFGMKLNGREAMHLCELRTIQQGHPTYRHVAQLMAKLIVGVNPHIGETYSHVDFSENSLGMERAAAEMRISEKRAAQG